MHEQELPSLMGANGTTPNIAQLLFYESQIMIVLSHLLYLEPWQIFHASYKVSCVT